MGPKKKSSKRGGKKPVFKPQPKGQGSSGRISSLLADAKEQMNAGKYGRASAALKKVLAIEEDHPEALRIFATLHLKLGSLMAAKTSFEALARKAIKEKDYRLAESLLREYLAVAPRYVPFLELLGKALEANGHFMAAVAEYGKAIEIFVEENDAELKTKGVELYETMKVIGAESTLTKKLATYFEESPPVKEDSLIQDEVLPEHVQSESDATGQTESPSSIGQRPSDEGEPAPFPWTPTDEPDHSSLSLDGAEGTSASSSLGKEQEAPSQSEDSSQGMESEGPVEIEDKEMHSSHTESLSEADNEPRSMSYEQTVDPLPWEEAAIEEFMGEEATSIPSELAGESLSQGESVEEGAFAKEEQRDFSSSEQTEESLIPHMSTPVSWDMPTPSSDVSIAPLPWEDNFEQPSLESDASEASDSKSDESFDLHQSSEARTESEATDQGLSFNAIEKDSSSFAPFPWEGHADSPDIAIPDTTVPSEVDMADSLSSTNVPEEEASSREDLLPASVDTEVPEDLAIEVVDDVVSSHAPVDGEFSPPERKPLSDETTVQETGLHSPFVSEDPERTETPSPDSEVFVSPPEDNPILEERAESTGEFMSDLSQSSATAESRDGIDAILDERDDTRGDLPESLAEEDIETKPLEEAAAEAVAALQGDPETSSDLTEAVRGTESSFSPFGQSSTLELKELPEENVTLAGEEESLAEAATEALTTFEDGLESPVTSPEESQIHSEFSDEMEPAKDLPYETSTSGEMLAEPSEDMPPSLEEPSISSRVERIADTELYMEEEHVSPLLSEEHSDVDQPENHPALLEQEETTPLDEVGTWAADIQAEDERVERPLTSDGDSSALVSEEALAPQEQEEEPVVAESVVEEIPIPLSPWDPQEDAAHAPSFSDRPVEEYPDIEEPVQEQSGFPSSIQFVQSEESHDVDDIPVSPAASLVETAEPDLQTRADIDIVYPEAESPSFQEEEEMAEELSVTGSPRAARSSGPTWTVAQTQGGVSAEVEHKPLFPTASKLKYKIKRFTQGVISTVRTISILSLLASVGIGLLGLVTVGIISIFWVAVEERPNEPFHNMMKRPNLSKLDVERNGYHILSQLGVTSTLYPVGFQQEEHNSKDASDNPAGTVEVSEVFTTLAGWYQLSDPITEFQAQSSQLKAWGSQFGADLSKYHQWSGKSFEDIGYRSLEGPHEKQIISVHQLFIAEGFSGTMTRGVDRLANDLEAWRYALGEAKTLRIKMLALEVIKDDLVILSALLGNPHLDRNFLPTLTQLGRPISHHERSLRWPMQNQFALEVDQTKTYMDSQRFPERPYYQKAMTYLPLPQQKIFNAHAVFYENLIKNDASLHLEGDPRKGLPKRYPVAHTPAESLGDYFHNPVDNIVMTQSKVDWRDMTGRLIELEARLRLTTLQARIRRPPEVQDPISRIAQAGQDYFDPFTGYTMLLNASKTRLYSVGKDGVDDDGDLQDDVAVPLFQR